MEKGSTSRRDFLKGIAVVGAGIAGAGALAACAPSSSSASASGPGEESETAALAGGRVSGYCGPGDWLGEQPTVAESEIAETVESDVVILGSGHSGVGAAFSAVDEGLSVSVIEQQPWSAFVPSDGSNGGGWYGEDIGHVNSQFLIGRGFGPYNTGEILTEYTKRAAGRVLPDIVRAFVQNSGPMFDRYQEIYDSFAAERKANDSAVFMTDTAVVIDGVPVPDEGTFDMSEMFAYPLCNTQHAHYDVSYPIEGGGYKTWPCNAQYTSFHFARGRRESKYFRLRYQGMDFIGLGLGARSLIQGISYANTSDLQRYLTHAGDFEHLVTDVVALTSSQRHEYLTTSQAYLAR